MRQLIDAPRKKKQWTENDNRPENLQIMKHSDHLKLHWQMAKERWVI